MGAGPPSRPRPRGARDRASPQARALDHFTRAATQCVDTQRRFRVSRDHRAVACRSCRPAAKGGAIGRKRAPSNIRRRASRRRGEDRTGHRHRGSVGRPLERPSSRPTSGPALGTRLEPRANCTATPARFPRRSDDAHQSRGDLSSAVRAGAWRAASGAHRVFTDRTRVARPARARHRTWQRVRDAGGLDQCASARSRRRSSNERRASRCSYTCRRCRSAHSNRDKSMGPPSPDTERKPCAMPLLGPS